MKLKCVNNVGKKSFILDVTDINDSRLYFHFMVKLPESLPDGEFTYYLYDDDMKECFGQGILQVGDYVNKNTTKYTKPNGTGYKQYNG